MDRSLDGSMNEDSLKRLREQHSLQFMEKKLREKVIRMRITQNLKKSFKSQRKPNHGVNYTTYL